MGGSKASGAGFNPFVEPTAVGFAKSRRAGFMIGDVEEMKRILPVGFLWGTLTRYGVKPD